MANRPRVTRIAEWEVKGFHGFVVEAANYDYHETPLRLHDAMVADQQVLPERGCVSFLVVCFQPLTAAQVAVQMANELIRVATVKAEAAKEPKRPRDGDDPQVFEDHAKWVREMERCADRSPLAAAIDQAASLVGAAIKAKLRADG